MTTNKNLKSKVRARAAKTGESYTSARRHIAPAFAATPPSDAGPTTPIRIAVAQTTELGDPRDRSFLRASGDDIRRLMRRAADDGARLVHFGEGATCWPDKHLLSDVLT